MARETMKAWTHSKMGLPSKVLTLDILPVPAVTTPTQVRVKISHCALNPGPSILMQLLPFLFRASKAIPELDFSGTIKEVGANVPVERDLAVGTEVFGSVPLGQHVKKTSGALAEYIVVDCAAVVKKPSGQSLEQVAGLGVAGCTALDLIKAAKLKAGDSVLVNGASGGIGHLVMQMCRAKVGDTGKVVAICSSSNLGWVKELGADEVVDYTKRSPVQSYLADAYDLSRFNAVIDAAGIQAIFSHCPDYLAEGKPYVTVGPRQPNYTVLGMLSTIGLMAKNFLWSRFLGGVPRPYVQVASAESLDGLQELAQMVEDGKLKVHVGAKFKMAEALQAYDRSLRGHAQGKIVVEIGE
ncbi:zinc-binding oxidoreductase [Lentithecium fluviatile CBS 122367]|uniref:Zinc-binding oxidoreductase n=1 Tax=Lentithecium fluviatile CBS 122367 TaxID=1168545 RepID=A0A6G1IVL8_9PLEO|nr:zinc-binding oxidoreductase [Lentithecium fluviatile CBS 122367]